MKILLLDIETAPNLATVWGLWGQNIAINQIAEAGYVLCWSAKWYGERRTMFGSVREGPKRMLRRVHKLLHDADVVVHYYGSSFDIPTLNKEFVLRQMKPPRPFKQVDLCDVVKRKFKFPSSKLDYVCKELGLGSKLRHPGHEMWIGCMHGSKTSWRHMEGYNRHDVKLLEGLYDRLKPWITNHPNHGAMDDRSCCPACGSEHVNRRGVQVAQVFRYPRYQCQECGHWFRGTKSLPTERPERFTSVAS